MNAQNLIVDFKSTTDNKKSFYQYIDALTTLFGASLVFFVNCEDAEQMHQLIYDAFQRLNKLAISKYGLETLVFACEIMNEDMEKHQEIIGELYYIEKLKMLKKEIREYRD